MGLLEDLKKDVRKTFSEHWEAREGIKVPELENLGLANVCVKIEGTVLYADLAGSTELVETQPAELAAEIYKTYLSCASKIIKSFDGEITAFDGDRIMAVYLGNRKNSNAMESALAINYAVESIINPIMKDIYKHLKYKVSHGVGIDTSELLVAKAGVRGSNDLVWIGNAANHAAKLSSFRDGAYSLWITEDVFKPSNESAKKAKDGRDMWTKAFWKEKNKYVYKSEWRRAI